MLDLTTVTTTATTMTAIAQILSSSSTIASAASSGYTYLVAQAGVLMDAAETAFAYAKEAGESKKAAVLAGLEALASTLGLVWADIAATISGYIDVIKASWTSIKAAAATVIENVTGDDTTEGATA